MANWGRLQHEVKIAAYIRAAIARCVKMSVIHDKVIEMGGPRSLRDMYTLYRSDIAEARAGLHEGVGAAIMEKALVDRDLRALELVAKTKLGWNEKVEVVDEDTADEDTSPIDDLIAALNLKGS